MQRTTAHALRLATIAVFVLVAALVARLVFAEEDSPSEPEVVQSEVGTFTVGELIAGVQPTGTVAVRGYLFEGGGTGVRLCHRRRPTNPPLCLGPFFDVYDLSLRGLPLKRGVALGRQMRWLEQPVTVYGEVVGSALTATGISR